MFTFFRIWWRYFATRLHLLHEEHADPRVQLEQAFTEARAQHRRLTEQAANVIANQQQAELRLNRAITAQEKADQSARQALLLADREARGGDGEKAVALTAAAEAFASTSIEREHAVGELEQIVLQTRAAAERARHAVAQNAAVMRKRFAEREQLLSTLDRAKLLEQMNKALGEMPNGGDLVPTLDQVQHKVEARLARAEGMATLHAATGTIDSHMLEVEDAQRRAEAEARVSMLRTQLGLVRPVEQSAPAPLKALGA